MEKIIEKEKVLEDLWDILEKTPKLLKNLSDNIASNSIREATFSELNRAVTLLPIIEKVNIGSFYEYKSYEDSSMIAKLIGFVSQDDNYFRLKLRTLYATKKEMRYANVSDDYYMEIKDISSWKEVTINQDDLPLHVGEAFTGTLLSEMIKNAKKT